MTIFAGFPLLAKNKMKSTLIRPILTGTPTLPNKRNIFQPLEEESPLQIPPSCHLSQALHMQLPVGLLPQVLCVVPLHSDQLS